MAERKIEEIGLKGNETAATSGKLHSSILSSGERMANAGKILAICWVIAIVTIFIPIAHFFLVPLFAIAGPVMAFNKYRTEHLTEKATGQCPECGKDISIDLDANVKIPHWSYCPDCNKPLQLVYHSASSNS